MRQDEHIDRAEGLGVDGARDVRLDLEARSAQHLGGLRVGGIRRVGRGHASSQVRTGGPGLAVALVDEHASEGTHDDS